MVPGTGTQELSERDQYAFDQLYQVIRAATAHGPVVLEINDVHLADPLSARWCSYVARRLDDVPAAVLVTAGHGDAAEGEPHPETTGLLADLGALAHCRVLHTGPLCEACAEPCWRGAFPSRSSRTSPGCVTPWPTVTRRSWVR